MFIDVVPYVLCLHSDLVPALEKWQMDLVGWVWQWLSSIWDSTKYILAAIGIRTAADLAAIVFAPILALYVYKLGKWVRKGRVAEARLQRAVALFQFQVAA